MTDKNALELFRLRSRISILEGMVLRSHVTVPVLTGDLNLATSVAETLKALEETAKSSEKIHLSDPELSGLDDAERALYAGEFRRIVEELKASVVSIFEPALRNRR